MSGHGQRRQHERRTRKTGTHLATGLAHEFGQAVAGLHAAHRLTVKQTERNRQRVGALRVRRHRAVQVRETSQETGGDMLAQITEPYDVLALAENLRNLLGLCAGTGEEGGRDELLLGHRLRRIVRRSGRVKPIAKLSEHIVRATVPYAVGREISGHLVDPVTAQLVRIGKNLRIAGLHVQHPRHFDRGIAPRGDGLRMSPAAERNERHVERHRTPFDLIGANVLEPALEEAVHVIQVSGGRREQADIARPAHALVTLRAVLRNGYEVGTHRPQCIGVQSIEQRIGGFQFARTVHHGVVHMAFDVGDGQLAHHALDLRVTEAMHRETRLPPGVRAVGRVDVMLLAAAQGACGDLTVRFEYLHMVQFHALPGLKACDA